MDKNTITAFVLIGLVLFGFSFWSQRQAEEAAANAPKEQTEQKAQKHDATDLAATTGATDVASRPDPAEADTTTLFWAQHRSAADTRSIAPVVLKNGHVEAKITPLGGMVEAVNLTEYRSYEDYHAGREASLALYTAKDAAMNMVFETKEENILTRDYVFTPENLTDSTVTMVLRGRDGASLALDYRLTGDYMLSLDVHTKGISRHLSPKTRSFGIDWSDRVAQHEKGYYFENMYSTLTYKLTDGDTEKLKEQGTEEEKAESPVRWVAFKNQYFSSCLIAADGFSEADFRSEQMEEGSGYLKAYKAHLEAALDPTGAEPTRLQYYFGPNNFRLLQSMDDYSVTGKDLELEDLVYLGWPVVRWINRFFTLYIFDFLTAAHLPMWLVLLLITLVLRVIVYGPTRKSFMSSAKMRVLRPKVEELAKKYPGDENKMKLQQETMLLYSQYGSSPMAGCLPMLIQMPIWIAMFNFVPNAIELRQQAFLWADDLSAYDSLISWETNIWGLGDHLSLFCILFCLTNLLYSYLSMRQQRETMAAANSEQAQQMKMMQWMMYLMPLMFFFMFNKYSAGLNYYYFISLLFSALTMWFLRRTTDDAKLLAKLEAYREKNRNNPKRQQGGLAARLQALQEQQQALLDEQRRKNGRM